MQYAIKWESKAGRSGYTTRVFDNYDLATITAEKFNQQSFIIIYSVVKLTDEIREETD